VLIMEEHPVHEAMNTLTISPRKFELMDIKLNGSLRAAT